MKRQANAPAAHSTVEQLEARVRELEAALQARDEFIATVGHELKNPLTPVYLQVQHLSKKLQNSPEHVPVAMVLPAVQNFAGRLDVFLHTLERILDVSRMSSGRIDLQAERLDLADVVRGVANSMEREFNAALTPVELHLSPVIGQWDRLRVEQICFNLLSNALRYGQGKPVVLQTEQRGQWAVLSVADRGMGIAPEDQQHIFERFDRGSRGPSRAGGFGVGLWVVKKICDAFGGDIVVHSRLDHGSTFVVRVPCGLREIP